MKMLFSLAAALPMILAGSAAMAGGYSGNWPLTVSHSQNVNGAYCLTLTDDGSRGWPHSGEASLTGPDGAQPYGTFQLIEGSLVTTIEVQGGEGQNAGLVFAAHASTDTIGKGTFVEVYGGEELNSGSVAFGAKGGC